MEQMAMMLSGLEQATMSLMGRAAKEMTALNKVS
jgi:hypothetical protein